MNTENSVYRASELTPPTPPKMGWRLATHLESHHYSIRDGFLTVMFFALLGAVAAFTVGGVSIPQSFHGALLRLGGLLVVVGGIAFRHLLVKRNIEEEESKSDELRRIAKFFFPEGFFIAIFVCTVCAWLVLALMGLVAFVCWTTFGWNLMLLARLAGCLVAITVAGIAIAVKTDAV